MIKDSIKDFKTIFEKELCYKNGLNMHSAWDDLMSMYACDISNLMEIREDVKKKRIKQFKECAKRLGGIEVPFKLFEIITDALWSNPSQDFLGTLYMSLGGNKGLGQVFTPYGISKIMAIMNLEDVENAINENGYVSAADPCAGAGAMLIASSNILRDKGFDPATQGLFFGQDIDETCVHMAYIQLALTGCAAVIKHGNSLTDPCVENPLFINDDDNYWYTPALYLKEWGCRRKDYIEKYNKKSA